jgi:CBS domain-containing protein
MTTIEEIMRKHIDVEKQDTLIMDAVKAMEKQKVRCVLVASDTEILGIVTSTDVLYKVVAKATDPKKVTLKEIMSSPVHAIGPRNTVPEAVEMMDKNKIKKLPVINEKGEIVGIVTTTEILATDPEYINTMVNLQLPVEHTSVGS